MIIYHVLQLAESRDRLADLRFIIHYLIRKRKRASKIAAYLLWET
jgi:hypothetical protein